MISYYGTKTKIANLYPEPIYNTIIEPFAGFARYSLRYHTKNVILYELDKKVFRIWKYLQNVSKNEFLSLPDIQPREDIRKIQWLIDEERWLIGFQGCRGAARPVNIMSAQRSTWAKDKLKIAEDLHKIKHWKIYQKDAMTMPIRKNCTYFIDPPYMKQVHGYTHKKVDYAELKKIINKLDQKGAQVIVCGNESGTWLDFKPLKEMRGTNKKHIECVYLRNCD